MKQTKVEPVTQDIEIPEFTEEEEEEIEETTEKLEILMTIRQKQNRNRKK